ncbi:MAG: helix-turn-helix domain-containing protein [Desulfovibrionaceae bacterium]|nr:helix-turn-helix domain-containing protein [Desulfovibrionaceae bacterium]MBF0514193.1 helix-turn-helix domain-containing protein [Desulfovibrionaceae bacterium]
MDFTGKDLQRGPIVPDFIMKTELNPGAKTLYGVLLNTCGSRDFCWPSQGYLASRLGQCVRSIQNYLQALAKNGFIRIETGRAGRNTYHLLNHPMVEAELARRVGAAGVNPAPATKNLPIKNSKPALPVAAAVVPKDRRATAKKSQEESTELTKSFDLVWALWPIKEARKKAFRAWRRLWRKQALPDLDSLLACIKANLENNPRWKRGYAPYLVAWLRDERWEEQTAKAEAVLLQSKEWEEAPPATSPAQAPDPVIRQFEAAVSIWPGRSNLSNEAFAMALGLWRFLHGRKKLPHFDVINNAAKTTTLNFLRWLHDWHKETAGSGYYSEALHA